YKLFCESDSQMMALDLLCKSPIDFYPHLSVIHFIRGLKARDWSLVFRHTLREDNACAHWLANYRAARDDRLKNLTPCPTSWNSYF
ncbi:hypothetical protein glysoja_042414, partial [Glycine soja]